MLTVTATGHGHRQREGVLPLAPRASCPCVPCIAAQAVARVGVRMAGWRGLTGLRSWWCDGVRGSFACRVWLPVLDRRWPIGRRQGPLEAGTRRGRRGCWPSKWHLASGIWHLACGKRQTHLETNKSKYSICAFEIC